MKPLPFAFLGMAACAFLYPLPTLADSLDLLHSEWPAKWITADGASPRDPGVYHFRKHLSLSSVPSTFIIHVSADNRFILFVNGTRVGDGPARSRPPPR